MDEQETSTVQLTVGQAAQHAGVSTKTIRRWLSSGRLQARFDGQVYAIEEAELDRAATSGRPTDIQPDQSHAPVHGQVQSIVQTLIDRLEQQAERIGRMDAELTSTRLQLTAAESRLLALEAPKPDSPEIAPRVDSEHVVSASTQTPATPQRPPWWMPWRRLVPSEHGN